MFLAALVDVGAPFETIRDTVLSIPELGSVRAEVQKGHTRRFRRDADRSVLPRAASPSVDFKYSCDHRRIELSAGVKAGAIATFDRLADAEAKVHGSDREDVHFHEVGALDAMFDIIGAHVALESLGSPLCLTRPCVLWTGNDDVPAR